MDGNVSCLAYMSLFYARPPVENGPDTTRLTCEMVMTSNLFLNLIVIDWMRWLGAESRKSAQAALELRVKLIIDSWLRA